MSRRWVIALAAALALVVVAVSALVQVHRSSAVSVSASSTAGGLDAGDLLHPSADRPVAWQSDGETVGAWVALSWVQPTRVDHVAVRAPEGAGPAFTTASLRFDGADAVLLTADADGTVAADFPARTVSSVQLVVATVPKGATSVALSSVTVDDSGRPVATDAQNAGPVTAAASSAGQSAGALLDGDMGQGRAGDSWTADAADPAPWVELSWPTPRQLASVQVLGPAATEGTSAVSEAAPLHGVLRFDDGSNVAVSGITGGGAPTTVAFMPRTASRVRLELARSDPADSSVAVSLRELTVHDAGTTPPRWPVTAAAADATTGYAVSAQPATECTATTQPVGRPSGDQLGLVCPAPGSAVSGATTVVVSGPPGTDVTATAWVDSAGSTPGAVQQIATGTTDPSGRAVLTVDTSVLSAGPTAVRVARTRPVGSDDADPPLYVQLVNGSGVPLDTGGHAPSGMTLQYDEEFTAPLSISSDGTGAEYAATKPSHDQGGSFGDAGFADPAAGAGTLATLDSQYLRIRAQGTDATGESHESGILASTRVGGSGFAAQYGYFEARMLGAPGVGSWPAFWMLDTENATPRGVTAGEVDAVELYGHNTAGSCHTTHNWGYGADDGGAAKCLEGNGFPDWALSWHTYGVRFVPGGADFFIDGLQVATYQGLRQAADLYYFLVDLALGGGWPVDLAPTGDVTDLYVDWVHVYT